MIRFFLKLIFYVAFLCIILSFFVPNSLNPTDKSNQQITQEEALVAVQKTFLDISHFCERNNTVCEIGGNFINSLGSRIRDGAKIIYEFLDSRIKNQPAQRKEEEIAPPEDIK